MNPGDISPILMVPADPVDAQIRPPLPRQDPNQETQDPRMTLQRSRKNLCPLNAETDAIVFNGGKGGLGKARKRRQLVLAQFLEFTEDADRFPNREGNALFRGTILFHL